MPPKPKDPPGRGRGRGRGPSKPQATRGSAPSRGSGRGVPEISSTRAHVARSKANIHPGQIQLDSQIKRRTKEEIRTDNAQADAEAVEIQQEAEAVEKTTVQKLAAAEDKLRREDKEYDIHASRPDLRVNSNGWSSSGYGIVIRYSPSLPALSDTFEFEERLFGNEDFSEGDINIPEASVIGTESSNEMMEIDDEGSDQDDEDYIENEEEEEDENVRSEEEFNNEDDVQLYLDKNAVRITNLI